MNLTQHTTHEVMLWIEQASTQGHRYYVYSVLRDDGTPLYLGKGTGDRFRHHLFQAKAFQRGNGQYKNPRKCASILKQQSELTYFIHAFFITEDAALELERELIAEIGIKEVGGPLNNLTEGGERGTIPDEVRQRRADRLRQVTQTTEWKERQREGARRSFANPDRLEKHREFVKKTTSTDDWREKQKDGCRKRSNNTEWLQRNKEARRRIADENRPYREECKRLKKLHKLDWKLPGVMCRADLWKDELQRMRVFIENSTTTLGDSITNDNTSTRLGNDRQVDQIETET